MEDVYIGYAKTNDVGIGEAEFHKQFLINNFQTYGFIPYWDEVVNLGSENKRFKNVYAKLFYGTAYQAFYADLAELYKVEGNAKPGDVIIASDNGYYEGKISDEVASDKVLGVVSENPGLTLGTEGIPIALKGKVKCKVKGPVNKGDVLVSYYNGFAISLKNLDYVPPSYEKVGIALESTNKDEDYIMIKI